MADNLSHIPPPSKPFPGSLTPGWNDPPAVNSETPSQGRPKLYLHKRVAFPVQGMSTESYSGTNPRPMACAAPSHHQTIVPPFNLELSNSTLDATVFEPSN